MTYKSMALRQGSAVPSDALARMRAEAIGLLTELYRTASPDAGKPPTEAALFEATRTPSGSGYSNELLVGILENSAAIVDFFSTVATAESCEILQAVEHKLLWLYQRNQGHQRHHGRRSRRNESPRCPQREHPPVSGCGEFEQGVHDLQNARGLRVRFSAGLGRPEVSSRTSGCLQGAALGTINPSAKVIAIDTKPERIDLKVRVRANVENHRRVFHGSNSRKSAGDAS